MELQGQRQLSIDRDAAWSALNDPEVLKDCIPGCQSIERTEENRYAVTIAAALGPVRATFRGKLAVDDIVAPESYTLRFEGEGGAAGFANGVAKVRLVDDQGTRLEYAVSSQIGGKLAQVGNRLIDSAARKLAEDFFACFERRVAPPAAAQAPIVAPSRARKIAAWIAIAIAILALLVLFLRR